MIPFDQTKETKLTVDSAMGIGTSATLWQRYKGLWRPVTHHSRSFTTPEKELQLDRGREFGNSIWYTKK